MMSTFIGPGAIFLVLSGALNTVMGLDIWTAILYNGIPVILFMFSCYFTKSKVQLSFAKLLTIGYVLLMLAVLISIAIQVGYLNYLAVKLLVLCPSLLEFSVNDKTFLTLKLVKTLL